MKKSNKTDIVFIDKNLLKCYNLKHLEVSMYLYLVIGSPRRLVDIKASVDLLKEVYGAKMRGPAPFGIGLVYATNRKVSDSDRDVLGVVDFD